MDKLSIAFIIFMIISAYIFFAPVVTYGINRRKIKELENIIESIDNSIDSIMRQLLILGGKAYENEQKKKKRHDINY